MNRKNKELKKIDIESCVYKTIMVLNMGLIVPLIILNALFFNCALFSTFVLGWNICAIILTVVVSVAGHNNFRYEMNRIEKELMAVRENAIKGVSKDVEGEVIKPRKVKK